MGLAHYSSYSWWSTHRNIIVEDLLMNTISFYITPKHKEIVEEYLRGERISIIAGKYGKHKSVVRNIISKYKPFIHVLVNPAVRELVDSLVDVEKRACRVCGRRFTTISGLVQHIVYHYYRGDIEVVGVAEKLLELFNRRSR